MTTKCDVKFEEKVTCGLRNEMEFAKFSTEHLKV